MGQISYFIQFSSYCPGETPCISAIQYWNQKVNFGEIWKLIQTLHALMTRCNFLHNIILCIEPWATIIVRHRTAVPLHPPKSPIYITLSVLFIMSLTPGHCYITFGPIPVISRILGIKGIIQDVSFWIVFFPRQHNSPDIHPNCDVYQWFLPLVNISWYGLHPA